MNHQLITIDNPLEVVRLKGSNHRVFFQNAEGNINMGVLFNDPDVDLDDICWYNQLAFAMRESLHKNEGLISIESIKQVDGTEKELKTYSCYVELHRNGFYRTMDHRVEIFLKIPGKPDKAIRLE